MQSRDVVGGSDSIAAATPWNNLLSGRGGARMDIPGCVRREHIGKGAYSFLTDFFLYFDPGQ